MTSAHPWWLWFDVIPGRLIPLLSFVGLTPQGLFLFEAHNDLILPFEGSKYDKRLNYTWISKWWSEIDSAIHGPSGFWTTFLIKVCHRLGVPWQPMHTGVKGCLCACACMNNQVRFRFCLISNLVSLSNKLQPQFQWSWDVVLNINKNRVQWFSNYVQPKFNWVHYKDKIFNVQTD